MVIKRTLKAIAEKTGLSIPTVSQILNNKSNNYSSEATKERVRQVAKEMGYQPNFGYKLMQGQKTRTVAVLSSMPEMNSEEYMMELVRYLIDGFEHFDYSVYFTAFTDNPTANLDKVRVLIGRGVEHFVFLGCPFGHEAIIGEIETNGKILIGNYEFVSRWVSLGALRGAEMIFRYLISRVGDNFKLICQEKDLPFHNTRLKALSSIYSDLSSAELIRKFVFTSENTEFDSNEYRRMFFKTGYDATRQLLQSFPDIGAIAYMNDDFALGGGTWILQGENEKFQHILLSGYNNDHTIQNFPLPITSVALDLKKQAGLLVQHALENKPCEITVYPFLNVRQSHSRGTYPPWDTITYDTAPQENGPDNGPFKTTVEKKA